jgi:hypothetical protein
LFGDAWSISDGGTLDSRRDAGAAAGTNAALLERMKQDSAIKQSLHNESAMILSISTAILCFFLRHGAQVGVFFNFHLALCAIFGGKNPDLASGRMCAFPQNVQRHYNTGNNKRSVK